MANQEHINKELELSEREAVILTRERTLEERIRQILRREQMVAVKEERIEALLRQLQDLGLHEMAADLEKTFEDAIDELEGRKTRSKQATPVDPESMSDGGIGGEGLWVRSAEMRAPSESLLVDLIDEPGLEPEERCNRFMAHLERELDRRERGEIWDRADRMRYLAQTFREAGNLQKAAEYARRALIILGHFS